MSFIFSPYSFQLILQRFFGHSGQQLDSPFYPPFVIPRPLSAPHPAHSLLNSPCCLPRLATPLYAIQTHRHKRAHTRSHTYTDRGAHIHDINVHTVREASWSHFHGMSEGLKKQGSLIITSESAVESVRAGRAGNDLATYQRYHHFFCICLL